MTFHLQSWDWGGVLEYQLSFSRFLFKTLLLQIFLVAAAGTNTAVLVVCWGVVALLVVVVSYPDKFWTFVWFTGGECWWDGGQCAAWLGSASLALQYTWYSQYNPTIRNVFNIIFQKCWYSSHILLIFLYRNMVRSVAVVMQQNTRKRLYTIKTMLIQELLYY